MIIYIIWIIYFLLVIWVIKVLYNYHKENGEKMEKEYYENVDNLVKIAEHLKGRETIFMNEKGMIFRNIWIRNAYDLKKQINHFGLIKNKLNIYHSIAKYSGMPLFSWNIKLRKEQYLEWTKKDKYKNYVNGYSFYIDFDNNGDYELTLAETQIISDYLKLKNLRHKVVFSGKGFHIQAEMIQQNPEYSIKIIKKLKLKFLLTTIDESIYKWQSVIKTPNSVDFKTMNICKIIDIHNFDKNSLNISNFIN